MDRNSVEHFRLITMQGGGDDLCWTPYAEWVGLMILKDAFRSYINGRIQIFHKDLLQNLFW